MDESETTDLAAMLPDIAQEMRARLEQLGREAVACWGGGLGVPVLSAQLWPAPDRMLNAACMGRAIKSRRGRRSPYDLLRSR